MNDEILKLEAIYRKKLFNEIESLQVDLDEFVNEYDTKGPMEVGIPAREANERVNSFSV